MPKIYEQATGLWALQADDGSIQTFATEQEAIMAAQPAAITEWAEGAQKILDVQRTMLRDANDLAALFEDNPSIYEAILATAPGEIVPGTTKTREALILMGALFQDTALYMAQAVVGNPPHGIESPPTRRAVVMAR